MIRYIIFVYAYQATSTSLRNFPVRPSLSKVTPLTINCAVCAIVCVPLNWFRPVAV